MFGLEILDVVIGLSFVYLVLSLIASAINEYIAATLNKRGKELAKGIGRLLDDLGGKEAIDKAYQALKAGKPAGSATATPASLTEAFYNHELIRPLRTERGGLGRVITRRPTRLPSYIPARTFALALLDTLGYKTDDAANPLEPADPKPSTQPAPQPASGQQPGAQPAPTDPTEERKQALAAIMKLLKKESPWEVNDALADVKELLGTANLPDSVKLRLVDALTVTQTRFQKLQDDVEVWFNNAMDRVSGSYKRHTQMMLFWISLAVAAVSNADTISMWNRLSTNEALAEAMANRAAATFMTLEPFVASSTQASTTGTAQAPDTTTARAPSAERADSAYRAARAQLDSMELRLGWTKEEAKGIGFIAAGDTVNGEPVYEAQWPGNWKAGPFWSKVLGLLLTGIALSLGAPFWFDLLNKIISVRAAGRSPEERAKSPEGPPKRAAEAPTK